jgi:ribosomal-protein-alanine N-acetyltransferase
MSERRGTVRGRRVFLTPARDDRREDGRRFEIHRVADAEIVGSVEISRIARGNFQSAYLGYSILPEHREQGYMTEALQLALRHAFRTLRLHRVEANVEPGNEPSLALVRRAGFTREGFSRRYLKHGGRWRDHERWALLAEDWRPSKRTGGGDRLDETSLGG